ncbi:MAG: sugar ABC transporter permease [Clostridia bacterium]
MGGGFHAAAPSVVSRPLHGAATWKGVLTMNSMTHPVLKQKHHKNVSYGRYGILFVLPFLLTFLFFQLYPIIFNVETSFTDTVGWDMINSHSFVGFENYQVIFDSSSQISQNFWLSLQNTVIIWVCNFIPQMIFALALANWFSDTRLNLRFRGGFKVLIFMPNTITAATIAVLFYALFSYPVAPINNLLQQIGIAHAPYEFLRDTTVSRGIISYVQWWMWYGNTMIVLIAGIMGINPSLFEAALVDGCTNGQLFRKITLPLLRPIMLYTLVTSMIGGLQMFDIPNLLTQGNPNKTTDTVARFIYMQAFSGSRSFNIATAASVILFVLIVILSGCLFFFMRDRNAKAIGGK